MMPFSVLRTWGLGLFSWLLLGAAAYLLYEYADGVSSPRPVALHGEPRPIDPANSDSAARDLTATEDSLPSERAMAGEADVGDGVVAEVPPGEYDNQGGWPYLAGGLALLGFSFGGFLPVLLLLGKPKFDEPRSERTGRVSVVERPDGTRLHVEQYGLQTGPTVVFTHGWSLDSTAWYYVKKQLGNDYRLVVWDLPGLGKSEMPRNRNSSIEKMAGDLHAVVAQVADAGPVVLVGHSIGGMITQTYCRLHGEQLGARVAGLVLVHTTYTNPLRTAWLGEVWTALEKPLIVPLNYLTIALAPLAWLSNWQSYLNGTLHLFTRFASFAGDQTWGQVDFGARLAAQSWPGVVARGNLAMLEFDEQQTLPKVEVPTLIVGSVHDRMTKLEASDHIDRLMPASMETVLSANHLGFWEKNEQFAEVLSQFLQKVTARTSAANTSVGATPATRERV